MLEMPEKIPYGSLAFSYLDQRIAHAATSRWLPSLPTLLIPAGGDPRSALESRGYFPWAAELYETHREAIEAAYAKAKSALYLWADPARLLLTPVEVQGLTIDWERAYPNDPEDFFAPSFAPTPSRLPEGIAPPPARVETLPTAMVNPLIDRERHLSITHPERAAAIEAIKKRLAAIYPDRTRTRWKGVTVVINLEEPPPLDVLLAYIPHNKHMDRVRSVLKRSWTEILAHVSAGETAVAILPEDAENDFLAASPGPVPNKPHARDLGHLFRTLAGAPVTFRSLIEDLVFRGELDPRKARFAVLLRENDAALPEKLAYIEARHPDSPLLPELRALAARPAETITHPVLLVDFGPKARYKLARPKERLAPASDWRDDFYEPPPQA